MSSARLKVVHAGPLVTLQDEGRFGALRYGVSAAGPMDRLGFASANASLARPVGQTAIEVSLGGLTLECLDGPLTLAITGGAFVLSLASQNLSGWQVLTLAPGEQLSIRGGNWGSWAYVAVAGQIEAQEWLGSAATASMTNFGGGALSAGKVLTVTQAEALPGREGPISLPDHYAPPKSIRVTLGPQDRHFSAEQIAAFTQDKFTVSGAYDRMGMRLEGPSLSPEGALSIPSEPILRGSVQVAGDGRATILLADHGTTGGYPKIATVLAEDQDLLTHLRAGDVFSFTVVTSQEALQIARKEAEVRSAYLEQLAAPRATLAEKLMQENLVGGVIAETPD